MSVHMNRAGAAAQSKVPWRGRLRSNEITGLLFTVPLLAGVLGFAVYPMVEALRLSFQQTNGVTGVWVGFGNYARVLQDDMFWRSFYNTLYMGVLSVILGISFSFILATLIHAIPQTRLKNLFKAVYFLPNVISAVATSILFSFLFHPGQEGLLNYALSFIGVEPVGWFTDPQYSRFSIVLMLLWGALGYNTIIFIAGLQGVPKDLYEAAEIDGAGPFKKWRYITIPTLRPIFVFMIVIGIINAMKQFTNVWLLGGTAGNPAGSLMTSVLYIYRNAFLSSQMGIATAASYLLFVFILLVTLIILTLNRKSNTE